MDREIETPFFECGYADRDAGKNHDQVPTHWTRIEQDLWRTGWRKRDAEIIADRIKKLPSLKLSEIADGTSTLFDNGQKRFNEAVAKKSTEEYAAQLGMKLAPDGHSWIPINSDKPSEITARMTMDEYSEHFRQSRMAKERKEMAAKTNTATVSVGITDPVVNAVREDLLQRSQLGLAKYGVGLDRTDLSLADWLQHAYEECLDQANYLKRAILFIGGHTSG